MSKSTKSTKYAHPDGQLPATQYGCTSGTTMVSDVITATVIIQNTQKRTNWSIDSKAIY